jgi:hypothetical protein
LSFWKYLLYALWPALIVLRPSEQDMSASVHGYAVRRRLEAAKLRVKQLEFLVAQLPIVNLPYADADMLDRLARGTAQFAYVNPATWQKIIRANDSPTYGWTKISPKCPTKFVLTEMIPEGGIVFTPNKMPGIEGL